MTAEMGPAIATALWLGILTSISPCPLATNVAAVSYVARRLDRPGHVLLAASAYSLGRALAYAAVSTVIIVGLLSGPGLSQLLQRYMNKVLGPLLVLIGMVLLDLIHPGVSSNAGSQELRRKVADSGAWGAALLGALFALSFCPVSAALFFGSLIPLSIQHGSHVVLPGVYGLGTALPVGVLAVIAASGTRALAIAIRHVGTFDLWARRVTGVVFLVVGIYLSVRFIYLA